MQTVTSNTPQQINSALFAMDRDIKNIEGNMDLQTQILTEAQTRSNADTALANSINSLSSEVSQVQQNITEEAQQRSDADTALTNSINNVASELSQAQLTAYAYGASGSAATDVTQVITISGSTSYNAAAGSRVLVSFPNGYAPNNEDSELLLQIGNMAALPALAQGVAMKYGSVSAGAMIEFTYTGSAWCCQSNIVKATSDYTLYADGSITYTSIKSIEEDSVTIQFGTNDATCYPLFSLPANTYVQGYIYANLGTNRLVDTLVIKDVQDGRVDINIGGISIKQTYDYEYALLPFCYKSGNSAATIYAEIYGTSGSVSFKVRRAIFN